MTSNIDASAFSTDHIQTVIFTPEHNQFSQPRLLSAILANYVNIFDEDVLALPPIPTSEQLAPELPRLLLKSKDERWELRGSPARLDIIWRRQDAEDDAQPVLEKATEILVRLTDELKIAVGRVALIINRGAPMENPDRFIVEHFVNDWAKKGPINRSDAFEIHNLKRYTLAGPNIQINSWMRCKTLYGAVEDSQEQGTIPVLIVEQDLNTLTEEQSTKRISTQQVATFFQVAFEEMSSILSQYFPEER